MTTATSSSPSTGKKRQASIAGFFQPKEGKKIKKETEVKKEAKVKGEEVKKEIDKAVDRDVEKDQAKAEDLVDLTDEKPSAEDAFEGYPSADHPSYHLPPRPDFNHPIRIVPPPASLVSSLRFNTIPKAITSPADLDLLFFNRFIDPQCARQITKYLLDAMPWYRVNYTVRGIDIKTPRYTTVFGKDATPLPWDQYPKWTPRAIPEMLLRLMQQVEKVTGETYNFALVNYYSSGTDSISYHSDSERFLGPNPCIASISLGAPRDFLLRHTDYKANGLAVQKFSLHDGDMVVMRGKTQHKWQHSIPKRAKADGRINITFRKGIVQYATENYLTYNVGKGPMFRWEGGKMVQKE